MKSKKMILTILIVGIASALIAFRLASNKQSFAEQLKLVSESNTIVPVMTDTVRYQSVSQAFSVNGTFYPLHEVALISETQGTVLSTDMEIGKTVHQGQVLLTVDHELLSSQLELAKANLEQAQKDLERSKTLWKGNAITEQQYEGAKLALVNAKTTYISAKNQFEHSSVKAPFTGIITDKSIEKGSYLLPGSPVAHLVAMDTLKLVIKLTANEVNQVKTGQYIKVASDLYPGINYQGIVHSVGVQADPSNRYDVEVLVQNQPVHLIRSGMVGTGFFTGLSDEPILIIPRRAIPGSILNPLVFLVQGDSVVSRAIQVIPVDDQRVAVKQGLIAGDVIVTSGQINLVNGSRIQLIH